MESKKKRLLFPFFEHLKSIGSELLTQACNCLGGWSGAMDPVWRDNNDNPTVRCTLDSCINGILDDALSADKINSRSIYGYF